eukprot:g1949.t1
MAFNMLRASVDGGKLDVADALREERLANRSVTRDTPYENLGYWDLHGTKVISLIVAQILFIVYTIVLWLESLPDFVDVMTGYPGVASSALDVYYGHSAVVGIGCLMVLLRAFRNLSLYTCRWKAHRKKLSKKRTFSQYRCCRAVYWYRRWVARSHAPYYPWWVFRAEVLECTFQAIAFAEFSWNGHSRTALIIYATVIMINATASPWLLATSRITLGAAIDITSDLFYSVYPMAMLLALYFDSEENKRWPHPATHAYLIGAASMRAITAFTNLQILHLTAASLSSLPVGLVKLSRLVSLKVNHNAITALHSNIARMTSLLFLEAMNNSLVNLPETGLGALTNLKEAYLQYNALTELPESFGQITGLQQLHVDGNGLQSLDLTGLVELHELQASFNNFTTLYQLGGMRMRHGRGLQLRGNSQLEAVDLSVVREGDADAFLSLSRDVAVRLGQLPRPTTSSQSPNTPDQQQHQQLRNLRVYDPINATHVNADKPVFDVHLARWRWGSRIPCCCYLYGRGIPSRLLGAVKEGEVSDVDGGEAGVKIECRADYERFPW